MKLSLVSLSELGLTSCSPLRQYIYTFWTFCISGSTYILFASHLPDHFRYREEYVLIITEFFSVIQICNRPAENVYKLMNNRYYHT